MKDIKPIFTKILDYIAKTQKSIKDLTCEQFVADDDKLFAASFALSQIAELSKKVPDEQKQEYPLVKWKELRAMRNRIVHEYDTVDFTILWNVVKTNLPQMAKDIELYL